MKVYSVKRGFTLIELMVVIIILGILAGAVIPKLAGRTRQARIVAAGADINSNISVALDLYETDNGTFPTTSQGLKALLEKPSSAPTPINWSGPYLKKGIPKDPWGQVYIYTSPGSKNAQWYDLSSSGPDAKKNTEDDIVNWEQNN
ncbi:MAG: type II secretion system major pseudopilin GspG [Candidatus Aureabacteria bacterium]|nr:type II secretion system major pseudopilin GspG [Candidatus Auribacterota bacterium]